MHIRQHNHQKVLTFVCHDTIVPSLLLNLGKTQTRNLTCYDAYNQTIKHFVISLFFGFNECF